MINKSTLSYLLVSLCAFIIDNISHAVCEHNFKRAIDLSNEKSIDTILFYLMAPIVKTNAFLNLLKNKNIV